MALFLQTSIDQLTLSDILQSVTVVLGLGLITIGLGWIWSMARNWQNQREKAGSRKTSRN